MKQSPLLPFPVSEYETRLQKVIAAMGKAGIDALVLTSDENTYYFSGFNSIVWDSKVSTPGTVVITGDGSIMLATSSGGRYTAGATSCVDDIRYYGSDGYATYVKAIVSLLEEKSLLKS
ncbi:MAG: aminopeptidase P family N-terminal domain-containing protein, partial [Firmicutes bacterium]|nr:aminopeptidase P family N-terminal domain-containing protein [Bacillota bacterium]